MQKNRSSQLLIAGVFLALAAGVLTGPRASVINPAGAASRAAVIGLFLITGLTLQSERIIHDLSNPRLHLFMQAFIFLLIPLYFLTAGPIFGGLLDGALVAGFYGMAVLPTTLGSCTVFTHSTHGNTAASVFNSALSNTIGIFLSPLLLSLLLAGASRIMMPPGTLATTLKGLAVSMFLPMLVGQLLRIPLKKHLYRLQRSLAFASTLFILMVVFFAIARTAENPDFIRHLKVLPLPITYLFASHALLILIAYKLSGWFRFPARDRLAILFTVPQKTLAMGAPMLTLCFPDPDTLGIVMLPIIFYHPFQLLAASIARGLPPIHRLTLAAYQEHPLHSK